MSLTRRTLIAATLAALPAVAYAPPPDTWAVWDGEKWTADPRLWKIEGQSVSRVSNNRIRINYRSGCPPIRVS